MSNVTGVVTKREGRDGHLCLLFSVFRGGMGGIPSEQFVNLTKESENEVLHLINEANELQSVKDQCSHKVNEVENLLKTFIYDKKNKPTDIESFIANQKEEIQRNLE